MEKENINSRSSLGIVEFPLIEWKFQTVDKALLLHNVINLKAEDIYSEMD